MCINEIKIRTILNSGGKKGIEAEVILNSGKSGIASAPSAILPGKREVNTTNNNDIDISCITNEIKAVDNLDQIKFDNILNKYLGRLGSDICLSISLAFAKASAKEQNISIVSYIEKSYNIISNKRAPYPLVAIFSGGVHGKKDYGTLQQIMLSVNTNDFEKAIDIILNIYNKVEKELKDNDNFYELGASSGFVVKNLSTEEQFDMLTRIIKENNLEDIVSLAIDVAAEHLIKKDKYMFHGSSYSNAEFANLIQSYKDNYDITFIEDPFDSEAEYDWIAFKNKNSDISIVGDDMFATQSEFINPNVANAIIIKMNQSGTLTNTIDAVKKSRKNNFKLCVSHRSYETEETFMCDLAVAINSEYIKIGGPRRGDRICKYNRMLYITKKTSN